MKVRIATILTIAQATILVLHYGVYKSFVEFFGITGNAELLIVRVAFTVLSVSFLLMSVVAFKYPGKIVNALYNASSIWMGTFYCLLVASVLGWLLYDSSLIVSLNASPAPAGITLFILALFASAYGIWNSFDIKIREVTIKLQDLPAQWVGRRAVLVADTHFGATRNVRTAQKVASLIGSLNPDITFFSGDFYDGPPVDYAAVAQPFSTLHPKLGTFFAAGNHEEYGNKSAFLAALRNVGMKVLVDEVVNVDGINVIGVDYADASKPEDEARILQGLNLDRSAVNILIKHAPDNVPVAEQAGVSLQLSGHTHLGQMWPFGYLAYRLYGKFYCGLNTLNSMQVYTTSGAGTWGPPQRLGTNSEVIAITFEK